VGTVVCAPDDGWKYHPKHEKQFPDMNKLCNVASCWIYEYTAILLIARPILHISRIKVNELLLTSQKSKAFNHTQTKALDLERAGLQILRVCKLPRQQNSHDSRRAEGHYKKDTRYMCP
jgi:hypothetical protein